MVQKTATLDPSKRSADAIKVMAGFGPDLYSQRNEVNALLAQVQRYFENGNHQVPATGEFTAEFSQHREGILNSLESIRNNALIQFDKVMANLDSPTLNNIERNELNRQRAALAAIADAAAISIELAKPTSVPGEYVTTITTETIPSKVEGGKHGLKGRTEGAKHYEPVQVPPVIAPEKGALVTRPIFIVDVNLPEETNVVVGGDVTVPGTSMNRREVLCNDLASMLQAAEIGTKNQRGKSGTAFWNHVLSYVGNKETNARQALCGSTISSSQCTTLINNIKNGNYDLDYLRSLNTPLSELVADAANNMSETWTGVRYQISAEAMGKILESSSRRFRLTAGAYADVTGLTTTTTTREETEQGVTTTRREKDSTVVRLGPRLGAEADLTDRTRIGIVTGVDAFQSMFEKSGNEWRYSVPAKLYYQFESGVTKGTSIKGELFGKIEYGKLSKEEYERLKMEVGGALVFIFLESGTTNLGLVTTLNAFKLTETEGGFEYTLNAAELGIGPELAFQLKKGSDVRIMIAPKFNVQWVSLGEDQEYEPKMGGSLDIGVSTGKDKPTVSAFVGVSESPVPVEGAPPVVTGGFKISW